MPRNRYQSADTRFALATEWDGEHLMWRGSRRGEYGTFTVDGVKVMAHRFAWTAANGQIPDGLCVLHTCDIPLCVNAAHLFTGTLADNNADRHRKGRDAVGDRNGARLHRELMPRGARNGRTTRPDRTARGERHWSRLHPELIVSGERNGRAKLTSLDVSHIRYLARHGLSHRALADRFGVARSTVSRVVRGEIWPAA